jgi:crotonobetainyl-CoA:carnitine CoA-transferase CaiB-like acyl-CoA transferase
MVQVLQGVKVVDLTMWAFVPAAGGVLSHWGADVIKIENPRSPDPSRLLGGTLEPGGASRSFKNYNRGKRAIALDLASEEGREVLYRLVADADVFLTSYLTDVRKKLRIDVDDIRAVNPNIVYAKGTGLGPRGDESERRGYDAAMWWSRGSLAYSAMEGSGSPTPVGMVGHGDTMSGTVLAGGICAALLHRALTGETTVVDGSLLATAVWLNHQPIVAASAGTTPQAGNPIGKQATLTNYKTSDGRWLSFVFVNDPDDHWADLCPLLGRPDLATDPRFATAADRRANADDAVAIFTDLIGQRTLADWKVALAPAKGVWAPIQSPAEIHDDPQVIANRYVQTVHYPTGDLAFPTPPVLFDEETADTQPAPDFGQHTEEILTELGFKADQIAAYRQSGIVA